MQSHQKEKRSRLAIGLLVAVLSLVLSGCGSLMPKKVEFFQDKVKTFPEQSPELVELERQALYRAHDKTVQVLAAAAKEQSSTNVVAPAKEAAKLTEAVAVTMGPPAKPAGPSVTSEKLAQKLESAVAEYNKEVQEFRLDNNVNAGKKIEGTGLIQISYFAWAGGVIAVIAVLFLLLKLFLSVASVANPAAAVGLNMVSAAGSVVSKGFSQLVKGGEKFKERIEKEISDPALKQKILDTFRAEHMGAQDQEVQNVVQTITK